MHKRTVVLQPPIPRVRSARVCFMMSLSLRVTPSKLEPLKSDIH